MTRAKHLPFGGISASTLKLLAMVLMVLDHLWATVIPGNDWMTYLGRMAFPIFAFQIAEGYCYTSDWRRYLKRLLVFALVSEVPFDLIMSGSPFFIFHQNVLFTFVLGLRAIAALDAFRRERTAKRALRAALAVAGSLLLGLIGMVDYGWRGVLTVILFWVLRQLPFEKAGQLVMLLLLNQVFFQGQMIPVSLPGGGTFELATQAFAVLAVIPIWLYNGKKGWSSRLWQLGAYAFYPAQFLLIWLVWRFLL